jgi:hypothetical protein
MRQIFREDILFFNEFIKKNFICVTHNKFCLSNDLYNHLLHKELLQQFVEKIRPYYLNKPLPHTSYINFVKIIRYICKQNKIVYEYKTKYIGSSYSIEYYISL